MPIALLWHKLVFHLKVTWLQGHVMDHVTLLLTGHWSHPAQTWVLKFFIGVIFHVIMEYITHTGFFNVKKYVKQSSNTPTDNQELTVISWQSSDVHLPCNFNSYCFIQCLKYHIIMSVCFSSCPTTMFSCYTTYLQLFNTTINSTCIDACSIKWLLQMHDSSTCFHHWVLLVMFNEFTQTIKSLPSTNIITVILHKQRKAIWFLTYTTSPSVNK